MWFDLDGDDFIFTIWRKTVKSANLHRDQGSNFSIMATHAGVRKGTRMVYLEGQLRGNTDGPEGEHVGYVLEVEVDMSAVRNTEELVNGDIAVTGDVEFVDHPERGKILVFRATSAAAVEEEVEETG